MKVIYGISRIRKCRKAVVTLGVFDGVHCAHRVILKEVVKCARRIKGESLVITFWPHPQKEGSLYSLEHRLRLISELGIDTCIVINFNKAFSRICAEDFIKDILIKKINAHYIYVGKNFRFGKDAKGDFRLLDKLSGIYNFKLKVFDVVRVNHQPISSTYIRWLIAKGDLKSAKNLLCRPVSVLGTVIKGASLGKILGFPTANINPHHQILPPSGVYAASVIFEDKKLNGICYIGTKPTFKSQTQKHIEVYIFNFSQNIYGKYLEIQFIKKIRHEKRFNSPPALVQQVRRDIQRVKEIFSHH